MRRGNSDRHASAQHGFSAVEILVVMVIVALLAGIATPMMRHAKANARSTLCMGKLRSIGIALNDYFGDHGMTFPTLVAARESRSQDDPALDTELLPYVTDDSAFSCPADHEYWEKTGSSYFWNSLLNGQKVANIEMLGKKRSSAGVPIASDKENFHQRVGDGVNVLYADGHVLRELQFMVGSR